MVGRSKHNSDFAFQLHFSQKRWTILRNKTSITIAMFLILACGVSLGQTLTGLTNVAPDGAGIGFLLTDGTVLYQGNGMSDWWKLTPDNKGSYLNGTWSQAASLQSGYVPLYFASAVLADGRVVIEGGEYNNLNFALTNQGAVYDPATDRWSVLKPPAGWKYIGDSPSGVLPDGRFVVGQKLTKLMAALDPKTLTWSPLKSTGKKDFDAEEGWTLLADGSFLTYDVKAAPHSERYLVSDQKWVSAGSTIVDLHTPHQGGCIPYGGGCYYPPGEVGPGLLRPDGTVLATGAASDNGSGPGHTAVYNSSTGKWAVGPDFPNDDNAGDSYAALLTNGNALVLGESGVLYEFDGKTLTAGPNSGGGYQSLIMLPSGEVIVGGFALYSTKGSYSPSWAPKITKFTATVKRGSTYKISGQQFNGLSQAASFGDELETATNYPLVRITNNSTGHVFYAKTHDHSTMGVATGTATVFTNFDVPAKMETGASKLEVVANGIPSKAVSITVN